MEHSKELLELIEAAKEMLNVDEIDPDIPLSEIGIDSMNVVELILACEEIYSGAMDPEALDFDDYTTLIDLHKRLSKSEVS